MLRDQGRSTIQWFLSSSLLLCLTVLSFPCRSAERIDLNETIDSIFNGPQKTVTAYDACPADYKGTAASCLNQFWNGATADLQAAGDMIEAGYESVKQLYRQYVDYVNHTSLKQQCYDAASLCLKGSIIAMCPIVLPAYATYYQLQDPKFLKFVAVLKQFATDPVYRKQRMQELYNVINQHIAYYGETLQNLPMNIENYFFYLSQLQIDEATVLNFACNFAGEAGLDAVVGLITGGSSFLAKSAKLAKYLNKLTELSGNLKNVNYLLEHAAKKLRIRGPEGKIFGRDANNYFDIEVSCN